MEDIVKQFIEEQKRKLEESADLEKQAIDAYEEEKKRNILIKAGMYEKEFMPKGYENWEDYPFFDNITGSRYKLNIYDIPDEDYQEMLKYIPEDEQNEIKTESENPYKKDSESEINSSAEKTLNTISYVVLVLGILSFIVYLVLSFEKVPTGYYSSKTAFSWITFAEGCGTLLSSLALYAIMQVLKNISLKLNK